MSNAVTYTVSHTLTPQVAKTWYLALPRTPRVMVPVHAEALVVRQGSNRPWARCGMQPPPADAEGPVDVSELLHPPFTDLEDPRPPGVYLHWALPDALTHGSQKVTTKPGGEQVTEIVFPAVPDRWLVLRLHPSQKVENRRTVRGWVLQAHDADPQPHDLDAWTEPGAHLTQRQPMTALGHGDASWSAYYDNVVNRMAFYDHLEDVPAGPIAYLVCGWYSDPTLDPLGDAQINSLADFEAKLAELRWSLPEKDLQKAAQKSSGYILAAEKSGLETRLPPAMQQRYSSAFEFRPFKMADEPGTTPDGPPYLTNGAWWPECTIYHGAVVGIGWPGIGWEGNEEGTLSGEEGGAPAASDIKVAFGNTLAEGLAALVGEINSSVKDARILEAFQQGLLHELNEPDGRARVDSQLHAGAFGSLPGGVETERVWRPASGTPPPPSRVGSAIKAGVFERNERATTVKQSPKAPKFAREETTTHRKEVQAAVFQSPSVWKEVKVESGGLGKILREVAPRLEEPYVPGRWENVARALPRFFFPKDPVVLLQGLKRSFQFGHDGRFAADGTLQCRLTGTCAKEYVEWQKDIAWPPIYPEDILDRGVENGSVPPECEELLGEVALLDPGSSVPIVESGTTGIIFDDSMDAKAAVKSDATANQQAAYQSGPFVKAQAVQRLMVHQTSWWATRDPRVDHSPLVSKSGFGGLLPSPVAFTPPSAPWSPVHVEWRIEYVASPGGHSDWQLGEADYNEAVPQLPSAGAQGVVFEGRSVLSAGANLALAQAVRRAVEQVAVAGGSCKMPFDKGVIEAASEVSSQVLKSIKDFYVEGGPSAADVDRSALEDVATALESMDLLSAGLDDLNTRLRGGLAGDGEKKPPAGDPVPSPFHVLRSGFMRVLRLRLVDCFGQYVDLAGSGGHKPADPAQIIRTEPLDVTTRPDLLALPPRFTSPARLWLRYMDAAGSTQEARLGSDTTSGVSPVCGYLMPNHIDSALLFYAADGSDIGVVRTNESGVVAWEDAPGRPSTVGQSPLLAAPNKFLGGIGEGLVEWGVADAGLLAGHDTALDALMRVIDSTLWSVDPFGHQGEEHLALLLGHPVVVMRAVVRLEVDEPVDPQTAALQRVPVRLGSLTHWQDGLFGFFVNDDYKRLYCAPAAAKLAREVGPGRGFLQQVTAVPAFYNSFGNDIDAQGDAGGAPVSHPYVDTSGVLYLQPNQEVRLTLLVEPLTRVHATSGILPRKDIGMRREWVNDALSRLSPTFRFGPVLIDPQRIRMPVPHDLNGTWSWDHRTSVTTWANSPVVHATHDALLAPDPPRGSEGWLRLTPPSEEEQTGGNP